MPQPFRSLSPNIETWSFDRVFNKEHFYGRACRKSTLKTGDIPLLIFGKSPKQPMNAKDF